MSFLRDLLSEKSGLSSMRLMSIVALLIAGWVAVRGLETHADLSGLSMLVGVFLTAAFGGKTAQKMIEVKSQSGSVQETEV